MKKGAPLKDDNDLKKRKDNDDYHVQRILKFFALIMFMILVIFLATLFVMRCMNDLNFQYQVLDIIKQNLSGIAFLGLTILGYKYFNR